jgi:transposase-like protein
VLSEGLQADVLQTCSDGLIGFGVHELSLRQLEEVMAERNLIAEHVTIWR